MSPVEAKSAPKQAKKSTHRLIKRRPFPYARVAKLWNQGKTIAQIAKAIGRYNDKSADPCHSLRVVLTRMHKVYRSPDGKLVKLPHRISRKTLKLAKLAGTKHRRNQTRRA